MQLGLNTRCTACPRNCGVARGKGFCGAGEQMEVSSICLHRGEEPPLVGKSGAEKEGIVNVFFAHCNLQCIYCQNKTISGREVSEGVVRYRTVEEVADKVCELLPQSTGILGFVTAAQYPTAVQEITQEIHKRGWQPTVVYNSSGYEKKETLEALEGFIDIYLPDIKYMLPETARRYSHAEDYPEVATKALLEMKRQVGGSLKCTAEEGVAYRGLIVRHLVLPGEMENSKRCLDWLAENFTPHTLRLSLMAQYFPAVEGLPAPLNRTLSAEEYQEIRDYAESLGLTEGWIQELESEKNYRPDFTQNENPFERET